MTRPILNYLIVINLISPFYDRVRNPVRPRAGVQPEPKLWSHDPFGLLQPSSPVPAMCATLICTMAGDPIWRRSLRAWADSPSLWSR